MCRVMGWQLFGARLPASPRRGGTAFSQPAGTATGLAFGPFSFTTSFQVFDPRLIGTPRVTEQHPLEGDLPATGGPSWGPAVFGAAACGAPLGSALPFHIGKRCGFGGVPQALAKVKRKKEKLQPFHCPDPVPAGASYGQSSPHTPAMPHSMCWSCTNARCGTAPVLHPWGKRCPGDPVL